MVVRTDVLPRTLELHSRSGMTRARACNSAVQQPLVLGDVYCLILFYILYGLVRPLLLTPARRTIMYRVVVKSWCRLLTPGRVHRFR